MYPFGFRITLWWSKYISFKLCRLFLGANWVCGWYFATFGESKINCLSTFQNNRDELKQIYYRKTRIFTQYTSF